MIDVFFLRLRLVWDRTKTSEASRDARTRSHVRTHRFLLSCSSLYRKISVDFSFKRLNHVSTMKRLDCVCVCAQRSSKQNERRSVNFCIDC
jgi:hypothetical protein